MAVVQWWFYPSEADIEGLPRFQETMKESPILFTFNKMQENANRLRNWLQDVTRKSFGNMPSSPSGKGREYSHLWQCLERGNLNAL